MHGLAAHITLTHKRVQHVQNRRDVAKKFDTDRDWTFTTEYNGTAFRVQLGRAGTHQHPLEWLLNSVPSSTYRWQW